MKYSKRLKIIRGNLGFSQTKMAQELGMTPQAFSKYETKDRPPPPEVGGLLNEKFNVNLNFLYNVNCEDCPVFVTGGAVAPSSSGSSDKSELQKQILTELTRIREKLTELDGMKTQVESLAELLRMPI